MTYIVAMCTPYIYIIYHIATFKFACILINYAGDGVGAVSG